MHKTYPLVTIVLITYNQEKYIREALYSVLNQTYPNLEVFISDDCSNDNTFSIIENALSTYKGAHKITTNKMSANQGLANHLNYLYENSAGEIIVHAAGDDLCYPNKVEKLVAPMIENDHIMGVHSAITEIDLVGNIVGSREWNEFSSVVTLDDIVKRLPGVVSQSHAFRKSVHNYFGSLKPDVSNEGKVLAFRELSLGDVIYLNEPLTYYRVGCGISTQTGGDINKRTILEPTKIAGWYYFAIKQISNDVKRLQNKNEILEKLILSELKYRKTIYFINKKSFSLMELLKLLPNRKRFFYGMKVFFRRNAPDFIKRLF